MLVKNKGSGSPDITIPTIIHSDLQYFEGLYNTEEEDSGLSLELAQYFIETMPWAAEEYKAESPTAKAKKIIPPKVKAPPSLGQSLSAAQAAQAMQQATLQEGQTAGRVPATKGGPSKGN